MATESISYLQSIPIIAENHKNDLISSLHKQQQTGNLCDVWLVIESEKYAAHKAVLASFSTYFHALFDNGRQGDTAGSKVCNVKEIVLSSVKKSTFLPILHFIYTSQLHVFKENITDILRTSRKLQITSIVEICVQLIEEGVVLPTLSDVNEINDEARAGKSEKNNILYVDFSEGEEEREKRNITPSKSKSIEETEVESTRLQTAKSHLGFEKLPETHSNGWPMRSRESASGLPAFPLPSFVGTTPSRYLLPQLAKIPQPVQVRSVYSMASPERNKHDDASLVNDYALSSEYDNPCFSSVMTNFNKQGIRKKEFQSFKCSYCQRVFSKKQSLNRHILIKHSSGHRFSCSKCGKTYAIEQSLLYHMSTSECAKGSTVDDSLSTYHTPLSSCPSASLSPDPLSATHEKILRGNPELLSGSLLHTSVDEVMSTTTTLFPSIASLGGLFDASQSENSLYKLSQEHYPHFSHSTPVSEPNTNSDDDMPTISRVESIRQPFIEETNEYEMEAGDHIDIHMSEKISSSQSVTSSNDDSSGLDATTLPRTLQCSTAATGHIIPTSPLESGMSVSGKPIGKQQLDITPLLLQHPVDFSSLMGLIKVTNSLEGIRPRYIQPSTSNAHNINLSTNNIADDAPSTSNTDLNLPRCLPCNKVFVTVEDFNEHKRKCAKCPYCCRAFTQYSNMKRHIDIYHTVQKAHKCRVCGRAYGIKQSLRIHMQTKHGIPFITRKYQRKMNRQNKK